MAKRKSHPDVEYIVYASSTDETFASYAKAAAYLVTGLVCHGKATLDVLIHSAKGARWYGGDDAVEQYNDDPDASVFERIEFRANPIGKVP